MASHAPSGSGRRGMQRRTSNATIYWSNACVCGLCSGLQSMLRRRYIVLSDDVRARSSNLARHDLGQGLRCQAVQRLRAQAAPCAWAMMSTRHRSLDDLLRGVGVANAVSGRRTYASSPLALGPSLDPSARRSRKVFLEPRSHRALRALSEHLAANCRVALYR
jgi:hypothetical protein